LDPLLYSLQHFLGSSNVAVKESEKIWLDGKLIPWQDANVHVLTYSLHYGLAAFEGIRCYKGEHGSAIFRLNEHVDRLFASCHITLMAIPFGKKEIADAIRETVMANKLEECYIRPLVFIGNGDMGLYCPDNPVRVAIIAWPWGAYLGDEGLKHGIRAKVSSFARHHVNVSMTRAKVSGHYVNSILASQEAKAKGFDEALLTDINDHIAEGPGANMFFEKDGRLFTPAPGNILSGITRATVLEIANELGIAVEEGQFTIQQLKTADAAFFCGTAAEVIGWQSIDDYTFPSPWKDTLGRKVQLAYKDRVTEQQHQLATA